jgi:hypothetical protein
MFTKNIIIYQHFLSNQVEIFVNIFEIRKLLTLKNLIDTHLGCFEIELENEIGKIEANFQNNPNFVNFKPSNMESLHFLVYLKLYQHLETKFDLFTGVYEC